MSQYIVDSGLPVSVLSGNGVMGAWTTVWDSPPALDGFYVMVGLQTGSTNQVGWFDVGLGVTPSSLLKNGKDVYNNTNSAYLFYPIFVPAGVPISIAAQETAGANGNLSVHIIGIPAGSNLFPKCQLTQMLFPVGGSNNFGPVSTTSPGTFYGTTLGSQAKVITLFGEAQIANPLGGINLSIWSGPSSSLLKPVLNNFYIGLVTSQAAFYKEFIVSIPPLQDLYLLLNSPSASTVSGGLRIFY